MSRSQYIYIVWGNPDYCRDGCCSWVAGVYTVKYEAEAGRVSLIEGEKDADVYVDFRIVRYRDGIQST